MTPGAVDRGDDGLVEVDEGFSHLDGEVAFGLFDGRLGLGEVAVDSPRFVIAGEGEGGADCA